MRALIFTAVLAVVLVGCAGQAVATARPPTTAPQSTGQPSPDAGSSSAPSLGPDASGGPLQEHAGDTITISCGGSDCLEVTVLKITTAKTYKDPQGYVDDVPSIKGDVFLAAQIRYKAIGPNADYSEADWAIYVDDNLTNTTTIVLHGPKPGLLVGNLPDGKSVTGWINQEIPDTGRVVLAYQPGQDDIFEIVGRSK